MYKSMSFIIEDIGEVFIERSYRTRRIRLTVKPSKIRVSVPKGVSLEQGRVFALSQQQWIRCHVDKMKRFARVQADMIRDLMPITDISQACEKIYNRINELSAHHGLPYTKLTIRKQKSRWGSCNRYNAISLNIKLARLPQVLMDYVILHELLHTRIKGHGSQFWDALDILVGDARRLRKNLKLFSLELL